MNFLKRGVLFTLTGTAIFLFGCAAAPSLTHDAECLREHVITVDGKGRPHDPAVADGREYNMTEYRCQIAQMFEAMDAFYKTHSDRKVLLFVHGGLNAPADSLQSADAEMDHVIAAGYYPIYLDWNSDVLSTYGEHLTSITQGQTDETFGRALMTPFYLIADILRAAGRLPIVLVNQAGGDLAAAAEDVATLPRRRRLAATMPSSADATLQRWARGKHGLALAKLYAQLRSAQIEDDRKLKEISGWQRKELRIYIGPDLDVDPGHMARLAATYAITAPTKFVSQPLIDWVGTPAWQNMLRRTLMAFDGDLGGNPNDPEVDPTLLGHRENRAKHADDFTSTGALEVFREELEKVTENHPSDPAATQPDQPRYHITLVGHSMGTMVLNEWLRRDLLESKDEDYTNIVYMAAACSVRDFGRAVVPYLLQHQQTQFYNLMLHPLAELRERRRAYDLVPRGSLLVWLDSFLTDPQATLDRTMGRWDNVISATELIPLSIRKQVTLKAFALAPYNDPTPPPCEPDYGPQEHGQFRGRPYWCEDFWKCQDAVVPGIDCADVAK